MYLFLVIDFISIIYIEFVLVQSSILSFLVVCESGTILGSSMTQEELHTDQQAARPSS